MSASPIVTKSDVLVASTSGWSPQRPSRPEMFSPSTELSGQGWPLSPSESGSPSRPSRPFDPNTLRSHAYVSKSPFKKPTDGHATSSSPQDAATSPAATRMGVGLGIGVASDTRGTGSSEALARSPELNGYSSAPGSPGKALHPSAQAPRKSRGFEVLTKSSYVSSSPFKQSNGPQSPESTDDIPRTRPLSISLSPKRAQRTQIISPPSTPSRQQHTEDPYSELTPRGASSSTRPITSPSTSIISPSERSLLHLSRLDGSHQPFTEQAEDTLQGEHGAGRRKTVKFHDELDVQEFDSESSFAGSHLRFDGDKAKELTQESPQQGSSNDVASDSQFWLSNDKTAKEQRVMMVNNSVSASSSPEMSDLPTDDEDDCSLTSTESRAVSASEASEAAEPPSPAFMLPASSPMEDFSLTFGKSFQSSSPPRDTSMATLGGINRIDSLVDELLRTDLLAKPAQTSPATPTETRQPSMLASPTSPATRQATAIARSLAARLSAACSTKSPSPSLQSPTPETEHSGPSPVQASVLQMSSADETALEQPQRRGVTEPSVAALSRALPPPPSQIDEWESQGRKTHSSVPSIGLPSLPSWSPLLLDSQRMPELEPAPISPVVPSQPIATASRSRSGGRPHISRDAVLERVAREKRAQAEAAEREAAAAADLADTSMPSSSSLTQTSLKGRPSAPAGSIRPAQSMTLSSVPQRPTAGPRPHVEATSFEVRQEPRPVALEEAAVGANASPLEKLSESLAQQAEETKPSDIQDNASLPKEQATPTAASSEMQPTATLAAASSSSASPASEASTSGLTPSGSISATADLVLRQRRSKLALRKRSVSTGDAVSPFARPAEQAAVKAEDDASAADPATTRSRASIDQGLKLDKLNLDTSVQKALDVGFGNGLCRDISRIFREGDNPYNVKDQGSFSAAIDDKVSHSRQAGDVDSGKAWRKLRRPSDINEYAEEMRAYRASENPKKAAGKVFVSVESFQPGSLGIPFVATTRFFSILDNGLHVVKTGMSTLKPGQGSVSPIKQEFELIQHKNLEFSLTLFVQRDAHLIQAAKSRQVSAAVATPPASPTKKEKQSFMSRLLRSPKKQASRAEAAEKPAEPSLMSYLNQEGALGKVNIVFEKVASKCLGKALTLDLPVYGVADPPSAVSRNSVDSRSGSNFSRNVNSSRGTLKITLFYLPPMPSVPKQMLPQNMQECIKGMQYAKWHHGGERMSGTLTQQGGDCSTWRRRPVKAQSSYLVCYNEVTKRPTVKIDLSKAQKIEEAWDPYSSDPARKSGAPVTMRSGAVIHKYNVTEESDESCNVPRSFRVTFADGERISFFADTDEEKVQWIEAMAEMIHTPRPPNPMWAQVAFETIRDAQSSTQTSSAGSTSSHCATALQTSGSAVAAKRAVATPATVREESPSAHNTPQRGPFNNAAANPALVSVATGSRPLSTPTSSRAPAPRPLSQNLSHQSSSRPSSPTKPSTLPLVTKRMPPVSSSGNAAAALNNGSSSSSGSGSVRGTPSSTRKTSSRAAPPAPTVPPRRASVSFTPTRKAPTAPSQS